MATDLALGNRPNPQGHDVEAQDDGADNHERAGDVRRVLGVEGEAEDDGEDDATEVAHGARESGDDTVRVRVHVRDEREVEAVGASDEEDEGDANDEDGGVEAGGLSDAVGDQDRTGG